MEIWPVLACPVELALTVKEIVPVPVPLKLPNASTIQSALLLALHEQLLPAWTCTLPAPPAWDIEVLEEDNI